MWYSSEHLLVYGALLFLTPVTLPHADSITPTKAVVCEADSPRLPSSMSLQQGLEPLVRATIVYSPTFRQQCRVLAAVPALSINIRVVHRRLEAEPRAVAVMRHIDGTLAVDIQIRDASDFAELLGHEFEHVIEHLDGVNLGVLATRGGATRLDNGSFETRRAIAAGQQVSDEVLNRAPDRMRSATGSVWRAVGRLMKMKGSRSADVSKEM